MDMKSPINRVMSPTTGIPPLNLNNQNQQAKDAKAMRQSLASPPIDSAEYVPSAVRPFSPHPLSPPPSIVEAVPSAIDFGEFPIQEEASAQFTLINLSSDNVDYTITVKGTSAAASSSDNLLNVIHNAITNTSALTKSHENLSDKDRFREDSNRPTITFDEPRGAIQPLGQVTIKFRCKAATSGRQTHIILVRVNSSTVQISLKMNPSKPQYLKFPKLDPSGSSIGALDLGYCYVDSNKPYAKVVPLEIQSVHNVSDNNDGFLT